MALYYKLLYIIIVLNIDTSQDGRVGLRQFQGPVRKSIVSNPILYNILKFFLFFSF